MVEYRALVKGDGKFYIEDSEGNSYLGADQKPLSYSIERQAELALEHLAYLNRPIFQKVERDGLFYIEDSEGNPYLDADKEPLSYKKEVRAVRAVTRLGSSRNKGGSLPGEKKNRRGKEDKKSWSCKLARPTIEKIRQLSRGESKSQSSIVESAIDIYARILEGDDLVSIVREIENRK